MLVDYILKIFIFFFMISMFVFIYLIFCRNHEHFKGLNAKDDQNLIKAFINRLYFVLVTITTIGYGDIAPVSTRAKLITIAIIIFIFLIVIKMFDGFLDIYKNNVSQYFNLSMKESFSNPESIQCGLVLSENEAQTKCPLCCIKNSLLYGGKYTTKDGTSYCKCQEDPNIRLYYDTYMYSSPDILKRTNGQVWYTGDDNIQGCVQTCNKNKNCRYLYMDPDKKCWNANIDPSNASKNYKDGYITGVKKYVKV